jgi:hypothetical protein
LEEFYFWNVFGNSSYIQAGHASVSLWRQLIFQAAQYVLANIPLWILSFEYLWILWRNRKNFSADQLSQGWLLAAWLLFTIIPVSVGKRFEDHYFLFLVPPLSLLSALTLHHWSAAKWRRWGKLFLAVVLLMTLGFSLTRYWMHPLARPFHHEDMLEYKPYAAYLRERTQPGDLLFVWGCAPAIYLFADRMPASRFLRTDVLAGRISGLEFDEKGKIDYEKAIMPGTWEKFWEDMRLHPPAYIMDTAPAGLHDFRPYPMTQYQPLMEWISANYVEEPSFLGATVYRRVAK